MQPLLCPLYLALEVAAAICDAWRSDELGRNCGEPGFFQFVDLRRELKSDDSDLLENLALEGRHVDNKLVCRQHVLISIFGSADGKRDVYGIVANPDACAKRSSVDPA
jgi:hypothetical protein